VQTYKRVEACIAGGRQAALDDFKLHPEDWELEQVDRNRWSLITTYYDVPDQNGRSYPSRYSYLLDSQNLADQVFLHLLGAL
jgi:hypothetical protein